MCRNDYLLCLTVIIIAMAGFLHFGSKTGADTATVRIVRQNEVLLEQGFHDFPSSYTLTTIHGHLTVTKNGNSLSVSEAPCPDKLCIKQGKISGSGSIVCIPEGVIVELLADEQGGEYDALLN